MPPFELQATHRPAIEKKGDSPLLCEAPCGLFRQKGTVPFFRLDLTPLVSVCLLVILSFMLLTRLGYLEDDSSDAVSTSKTVPAANNTAAAALRVRLTADAQGELMGISLGERRVGSLQELQDQIRRNMADNRVPCEVEFDCDYRLRYAHVLRAMTAVSGYRADDGRTLVRLTEKVKFAPPHREQVP